MKKNSWVVAAAVLLSSVGLQSKSLAYDLILGGQVFPQNAGEPNLLQVNLDETDGATSKSFDSGVIYSASDGVSSGRFTADVDFATGTLRTTATASGDLGLAGASLGLNESLTFHLPPGMESTTVRFALTVDGTYSSPPPDEGYYVSGYAGISFGGRGAGNGGDSDASTFVNRSFSGELVVNDGNVVGLSASFLPYIDGLVGRGSGVVATYDLSARISLDLEPGVTFTSQSGTFLTESGPLASFSLSKAAIAGCKSTVGKVVLSEPAPVGGLVVGLSDDLAATTMPATLKIPEGATVKSFTVKSIPVSSPQSGQVRVTLGGTSLSQDLTVRPIGVLSLGLSPSSTAGSQPSVGTVKLECGAGPGPVTVDLSSSNPAAANPVAASIVVPQAVQSVPFDMATNPVLAKATTTIAATANGITRSKVLTVTPAAAVSPSALRFGSVPVGATSGTLNATLTNNGALAISVGSISLTGTNAKYYSQSNNCPASLPAGSSCTIGVKFAPTVTGSKSAKLSIATSATSTPLSVALSGTGL